MTQQSSLKVAFFALLALSVQCKIGVDFGPDWANNFQPSDLQCLRSTGIKFAIIRSWQKYGAVDKVAIQSLKNANAAGFEWVDTYLFPCRTIDPRAQVQQLVANLTQAGAQYRRLWLDIESNPWAGCGWDNFTFEENCQFAVQLVDEVRKQGKDLGIYASHYMWVQLFGNDQSCQLFTDVPLWYARFDGKPTFDDFYALPFGGWKQPYMKQYIDLTRNSVCGFTIDQDYIPDNDIE